MQICRPPVFTGAWSSFYDKASAQLKVKQAELGYLRAFFGPSTLFLNRHVGATIVPLNLSYLQELKQLACYSLYTSVSCPPYRFSFCTIDRWSCYSIQHCYEKNVPTGVIFDQIFKIKTLLEASSLEGYFSFEYQTWNDGMTDVHGPPTLTLRSRTGAAKPTLWPTLNPYHFTVPCFIFKTKTFSFSSKQALSNNVFVVKIGRTTTLRRLFKVINFRRSKFVCTLWPCPVFGMCAAGLATHLTTPVCPVARTQTIILQVVYCNRTGQLELNRIRKSPQTCLPFLTRNGGYSQNGAGRGLRGTFAHGFMLDVWLVAWGREKLTFGVLLFAPFAWIRLGWYSQTISVFEEREKSSQRKSWSKIFLFFFGSMTVSSAGLRLAAYNTAEWLVQWHGLRLSAASDTFAWVCFLHRKEFNT